MIICACQQLLNLSLSDSVFSFAINLEYRNPLGRLPSNVSELSETSDLKSSTACKFNYRAYRKKISTKHDTVTDLFVYNPVS